MTSTTAKRYTTTEYGKQNIFASSPQPWIDDADKDYDYWKNAELLNGRLAMIGLVIGIFNYTVFGWVIPGLSLIHI